MNITKKRDHQFSHFFHKNNNNSETKKDYISYYTSICVELSRLQSILHKLSSMNKYKEIIKEIPLYFCVKCENFEFSTHLKKS